MRHVVIHYHIFKNAGSTVDSILERNFDPSRQDGEGPTPYAVIHYRAENARSAANAILKGSLGPWCGSIEGPNPWDTLNAETVLEICAGKPVAEGHLQPPGKTAGAGGPRHCLSSAPVRTPSD
jgi:hypothetical protein